MNSLAARPAFPYFLYLAAAAALFPLYRFDLSPDQVSYLNLAHLYAEGHIQEAINGFWSPLLSWLIAPWLWLGFSGPTAGRIVCILAGLLAVHEARLLLPRFAAKASPAVMAIAALFTATIALRISADLLAAAFLLRYLREIWQPDWTRRVLRIAVMGGILYLSKNYLLFFFLMHVGWSALLAAAQDRKHAGGYFRAAGQAMAIAAVCCLPWIGLLSAKYGKFTVSRAGAVNIGMVGPESAAYRPHKVLVAPSSPHAISALQDPPPEALPAWSLVSVQGVRQMSAVVKKNLLWLFDIYQRENVFWLLILVLYILTHEGSRPDRSWIAPVSIFALLPAGYLMVVVVDRYLWVSFYILLFLGTAVLARMQTDWVISPAAYRVLAAAGAVSFLWPCINNVRNSRDNGIAEWKLARQLRAYVKEESRIVSCGNYESTLMLSYYLGARYYGLTREGPEDRQYARELNPNFDRAAAAAQPPEPSDAGERLDTFQPQWLLVWPSCGGLSPTITDRLLPETKFQGTPGPQLRAFIRQAKP